MFWNKTNSKRIDDLDVEMRHIKGQLEALKLDLELYVRKLKQSKGLKPVKEELGEESDSPKNIKDSVLLPP